MFGVMVRPIRRMTAIWYELDCNTSTQKSNSGCHAPPTIASLATAVSPLASLNIFNYSNCRILDGFRELTINRLTIEINEEDLSQLRQDSP